MEQNVEETPPSKSRKRVADTTKWKRAKAKEVRLVLLYGTFFTTLVEIFL